MDISTLLPLLMQGKSGEDDKMSALLKTMAGTSGGGAPDKTKLLTDLIAKDQKNNNLADILALTQTLNSTAGKPPPPGLSAIKTLAPSDILGMLFRYYSGRNDKK